VGLKILLFVVAASSAVAQTLPEGPGKEVVEAVCSTCHAPTRAAAYHGSKMQWQSKVTEMLQEETDVSDSDVTAIVNYLAKNFPPVKVNVNKAAARELQDILEVTAVESEAVVHYREQKGNFKTLDDLKKVPGIDAVKIESKRDQVEF
jgi:competence protein ComEA